MYSIVRFLCVSSYKDTTLCHTLLANFSPHLGNPGNAESEQNMRARTHAATNEDSEGRVSPLFRTGAITKLVKFNFVSTYTEQLLYYAVTFVGGGSITIKTESTSACFGP